MLTVLEMQNIQGATTNVNKSGDMLAVSDSSFGWFHPLPFCLLLSVG